MQGKEYSFLIFQPRENYPHMDPFACHFLFSIFFNLDFERYIFYNTSNMICFENFSSDNDWQYNSDMNFNYLRI